MTTHGGARGKEMRANPSIQMGYHQNDGHDWGL